MEKFLTVGEAAKLKGVSTTALYTAIAENRLPSQMVLNRLALRERDVLQYEPTRYRGRAGAKGRGGRPKGTPQKPETKERIAASQARQWQRRKDAQRFIKSDKKVIESEPFPKKERLTQQEFFDQIDLCWYQVINNINQLHIVAQYLDWQYSHRFTSKGLFALCWESLDWALKSSDPYTERSAWEALKWLGHYFDTINVFLIFTLPSIPDADAQESFQQTRERISDSNQEMKDRLRELEEHIPYDMTRTKAPPPKWLMVKFEEQRATIKNQVKELEETRRQAANYRTKAKAARTNNQ